MKEPDPRELPELAASAKHLDKAWVALFKAVDASDPAAAAAAIREFQSLLDDDFFSTYYATAPDRFKNTLKTLRDFKDELENDAANSKAGGRAASGISALVGVGTTAANLWAKDTARTAWFGCGAGILILAVGVLWLWSTERKAAHWDFVLRNLDTLLSDIRKQGPGK